MDDNKQENLKIKKAEEENAVKAEEVKPAVLDASDDSLCCRPVQMVLNRTSAGESAAYGLLFFSLACYCFLDLHSCHWFDITIYQRRGLMFDVSDLIFRSNLSLIQFSRYELYIYDIYVPGVLHAISTQEVFPRCSSHAKRCSLVLKNRRTLPHTFSISIY